MKTIIENAANEVARISAELAACEARIAHINWLVSPDRPVLPSGYEELETERDMLRYQTRGNLMVDLRAAMRTLESEVCR